MDSIYIIAFNSTHHAIRTEKILKEENMNIRTIPTPREVSSSCGLSIKFEESEIEKIKQIIEESKVDYHGIFKLTKNADGKKEANKIF